MYVMCVTVCVFIFVLSDFWFDWKMKKTALTIFRNIQFYAMNYYTVTLNCNLY